MKYYKVLLFFLIVTLFSCNKEHKAQVTFIELGSIKCKPCIQMQEVIKKVEAKYPKKVKTIFYDVWTKDMEHFADDYKIDAIPTQIFLDKNGREFFRHEGYFKFEELEKILLQKIN